MATSKSTSLDAQALKEKKIAVIRKYSGRLFYKVDPARSIRMLVQMDCPKEWYTEINDYPLVLQSTLNPTTFMLTKKLCQKLDISFDIIKKKKKKQKLATVKNSKSLLQRYDEICKKTSSTSQKENPGVTEKPKSTHVTKQMYNLESIKLVEENNEYTGAIRKEQRELLMKPLGKHSNHKGLAKEQNTSPTKKQKQVNETVKHVGVNKRTSEDIRKEQKVSSRKPDVRSSDHDVRVQKDSATPAMKQKQNLNSSKMVRSDKKTPGASKQYQIELSEKPLEKHSQHGVHFKTNHTSLMIKQTQNTDSVKLVVSNKKTPDAVTQLHKMSSMKPSSKPQQKTALYKSCFKEALLKTAQFKKVIRK